VSNVFGRRFRVLSWGESHGPALGAVIDGCPAGVKLEPADIQRQMERDVPDVRLGTSRREANEVEMLSGVFEGRTLGTPISLVIRNTAVESQFYERLKDTPRPGHGDLTYRERFGHVDWRGGGRASGRECIARLAAGAVARVLLRECGISIASQVTELAGLPAGTLEEADRARQRAVELKGAGDSSGGMLKVSVTGVPAGVGAPVFAKLEADLAAAMLSIGGVKSFAIGAGFEAAKQTGSQFNDSIVSNEGHVRTATNNAGGVLAGITTGEEIWVLLSVKPTPTIGMPQRTVDLKTGCEVDMVANGHFDANFTPRAAVVAESMAALVLVDHLIDSGQIHPVRFDLSPLLSRPGQIRNT